MPFTVAGCPCRQVCCTVVHYRVHHSHTPALTADDLQLPCGRQAIQLPLLAGGDQSRHHQRDHWLQDITMTFSHSHRQADAMLACFKGLWQAINVRTLWRRIAGY